MLPTLLRLQSLLVLLASGLIAFGAAAEGVDVQRSRFLVVPAVMTSQISAQQYAQMKREAQAKGALNAKPEQVRRVQEIAGRIVPQGERFNPGSSRWAWEANVINAPTVNAFAMPSGKVMVYAGLMERLQLTDDELAAVIGHEIAHAVLGSTISEETVTELARVQRRVLWQILRYREVPRE